MSELTPSTRFPTRSYSIDSKVGSIRINEMTSTEAKSDTPLILAPGWLTRANVFKDAQKVLASHDRSSIAFDHPRLGGEVPGFPPYPDVEVRKAVALLEVIRSTGKPADVIAHSEGTFYTMIAALMDPERFNNIVLMAPAGLAGPDPDMTARFKQKEKRALHEAVHAGIGSPVQKGIIKEHVSMAVEFARNPVRAIKESKAIPTFDLPDLLEKARSKGIGVVAIHHAEDDVIPMRRVQDNFTALGKLGKGYEQYFDGILAVTGIHDDIATRPEKYVAAAAEMLSALEAKKSHARTP